MLHCSVRQKWTHSFNCVLPENMHTPSPRRATELQRGGGGGRGGQKETISEGVFRVRLISKPSFILLLIGVSKQKLSLSSMIFYSRSAECFFHGLHDSFCNTIVVDS